MVSSKLTYVVVLTGKAGNSASAVLQRDVVNTVPKGSCVTIIDVRGQNAGYAAMMNKVVRSVKTKYYAVVPLKVKIYPSYEKEMMKGFAKGNVVMVYSDYNINNGSGKVELKQMFDYNSNFTERFEFGLIQIFDKARVIKAGGYRSKFTFPAAVEYDLRLRLFNNKGWFQHIKKALYENIVVESKESKLFEAFKYLQYNKKYEREVENAFYDFLKSSGTFLLNKSAKVQYGKNEKFLPLVSIVSPVFNRDKWVAKAIESVLRQTFKDWEMILVDNASTDNTVKIIKSYMAKDKRIKLIQNKNYRAGAIAYCLNRGIAAGVGKYYAQLDSDDEYTPDCLATMVKYMESHPATGLAVSYYDLVDEKSKVLSKFGVIKHLEFNRNNILRCEGAGALRMWHRKVWREFGGFDEKNFGAFGEDYDLVLKTCEKYDVGRVHKVLYHYRRHSDVTDMVRSADYKQATKTMARVNAWNRRKKFNKGN